MAFSSFTPFLTSYIVVPSVLKLIFKNISLAIAIVHYQFVARILVPLPLCLLDLRPTTGAHFVSGRRSPFRISSCQTRMVSFV